MWIISSCWTENSECRSAGPAHSGIGPEVRSELTLHDRPDLFIRPSPSPRLLHLGNHHRKQMKDVWEDRLLLPNTSYSLGRAGTHARAHPEALITWRRADSLPSRYEADLIVGPMPSLHPHQDAGTGARGEGEMIAISPSLPPADEAGTALLSRRYGAIADTLAQCSVSRAAPRGTGARDGADDDFADVPTGGSAGVDPTSGGRTWVPLLNPTAPASAPAPAPASASASTAPASAAPPDAPKLTWVRRKPYHRSDTTVTAEQVLAQDRKRGHQLLGGGVGWFAAHGRDRRDALTWTTARDGEEDIEPIDPDCEVEITHGAAIKISGRLAVT